MSLESNARALKRAERCLHILGRILPLLYLSMIAALYAAFLYAPPERVMGEVQRIFYFHVGAAWNALYICFFVVFVAGIAYLRTRKRIWDQVGATCVEIGLTFATINLLTGILWARPIWNTWWPWGDPRVTSMAVLWLIYAAYLIYRSSLAEGDKKYTHCAVFGIIGFLDVPIVTVSIRIWKTIHPVVITTEKMNLETEMIVALLAAVLAFSLLLAALFCLRLSQRLQGEAVGNLLQKEF